MTNRNSKDIWTAVFSMDEDILKALAEAGNKGLSLQKIVIYAYNSRNGLFFKYEKDAVRKYVIRFLRKNAQYRGSPVQRISRGVYRLNPDSDTKSQLLLSFDENRQERESVASTLEGKPVRTLFDDLL